MPPDSPSELAHQARKWPAATGRLRLKMQKIHRVNLVRLNLLQSRQNYRTALNLSPSKPARSLQKKYGDAFENDFHARLGVMMEIHSRFIARPLNRFTHVESIQPGFQVLSNGHESIERTRFNGFKFNRRRPLNFCTQVCSLCTQVESGRGKTLNLANRCFWYNPF